MGSGVSARSKKDDKAVAHLSRRTVEHEDWKHHHQAWSSVDSDDTSLYSARSVKSVHTVCSTSTFASQKSLKKATAQKTGEKEVHFAHARTITSECSQQTSCREQFRESPAGRDESDHQHQVRKCHFRRGRSSDSNGPDAAKNRQLNEKKKSLPSLELTSASLVGPSKGGFHTGSSQEGVGNDKLPRPIPSQRKGLPELYQRETIDDSKHGLHSSRSWKSEGCLIGLHSSRSQQSEGNLSDMCRNEMINDKIGSQPLHYQSEGNFLEHRKKVHLAVGSKSHSLRTLTRHRPAHKLHSLRKLENDDSDSCSNHDPVQSHRHHHKQQIHHRDEDHHPGSESVAMLRNLKLKALDKSVEKTIEDRPCGFSIGDRVAVCGNDASGPWKNMGDGFVLSAATKKGYLTIEFEETHECFDIKASNLTCVVAQETPTRNERTSTSHLKVGDGVSLGCGTPVMSSFDAIIAARDRDRDLSAPPSGRKKNKKECRFNRLISENEL